MASTPEVKIKFSVFNQDFTKAVGEMKAEISSLSKELKLADAAFKNSGNETAYLTDKLKILEKQYENSRKITQETATQLEKAKAFYGENSNEVRKLSDALLVAKTNEEKIKTAIDQTNQALQTAIQKEKQATDESKRRKDELANLAIKEKDLADNANKLSKEYQLQVAELSKNASETEKLKIKLQSLKDQYQNSKDQVKNLEEQLKLARAEYGNNSTKVKELELRLIDAKIAQANFRTELESTTRSLSAGATLQKVGAALKDIGSKITQVGRNINTYLGTPLKNIGKSAIQSAMDFETGIAKVSTLADTSKVSIGELKDGVLALSNESGKSTSELSEALYQTLSASVKTEDALGFLEVAVKTAKGGFTDTTTAVDGLTTVLNAYGLGAENADKIANQMLITQNLGKTTFAELAEAIGNVAPTASQLGVTTEELFSSLASLTMQGIDTDTAVTSLRGAMTNIIKPTEGAKKVAGELGMEFSASAVSSKGWMGFLQDIRTNLQDAEPQYANALNLWEQGTKRLDELSAAGQTNSEEYKNLKVEVAGYEATMETLGDAQDSTIGGLAEMFGGVRSLNGVLALTSEEGAAKYDEAMGQMVTNTDALSDAATKMEETTQDKFNVATNSIKNSFMSIGEQALPIIQDLAGKIQELAAWFAGLDDQTKKNILFSGAAIVGLGIILPYLGMIISAIGSITSLIGRITTVIGGPATLIIGLIIGIVAVVIYLWNTCEEFRNAVIAIWEAIKNAFLVAGEIVKNIWNGIVDFISTAIENIWNTIVNVLTAIKEFISTTIENIWNTIVNIFTAVSEFISNLLMNIYIAFATVWNGIADFIGVVLGLIWFVITSIWNAIDEYIIGALTAVWDFVTETWNSIYNAIANVLSNIWDTVSTVFTGVWNFIVEVWNSIYNAIASALEFIWGKISEVWNAVKEFIVTTANDIWTNISDTFNNIKGTVSEVFGAVWDKIKEIVGGIYNSIKEKFELVLETVTGIFNSIKDAIVGPIEVAKQLVGGIIDNIMGFFEKIKLNIPKIDIPVSTNVQSSAISTPEGWYATGGIFKRPAIIGVGESGPEAVLPIKRLSDILADTLSSMNANLLNDTPKNYYNVTINNTVRNDSDLDYIVNQVDRILGGRINDI